MFDYLYEWLENLSFYLILVTAVTYVLPENGYRKYIRLFTGLVLICMLLNPIFQLFHVEFRVTEFYDTYISEEEMNEMWEKIDDPYMESDTELKNRIEVEEIVIEP